MQIYSRQYVEYTVSLSDRADEKMMNFVNEISLRFHERRDSYPPHRLEAQEAELWHDTNKHGNLSSLLTM